MASKIVKCYTYELRKNKVIVNTEYLKDIINVLFNPQKSSDVKELNNGNLVKIYKEDDEENYLSIELINEVSRELNGVNEVKKVYKNHLLFRIGRKKDIDGAMKRNLDTWEGREIIDKSEQDVYELEICTYILIDVENGIILELFGKYAPSVKSLTYVLNMLMKQSQKSDLEGLVFQYKNIMTEELIESLKDDGVRLGKINYSYEPPNLNFLKELGLTTEEINAIYDLGVYEVEVIMKGRGKSPLTRTSDKIKKLISTISRSPKKVKDKISFIGSTNSSSSKKYTFREEDVTYKLDIPYNKTTDNCIVKLSLDEIAYEVYIKFDILYTANKNKIVSYINKERN